MARLAVGGEGALHGHDARRVQRHVVAVGTMPFGGERRPDQVSSEGGSGGVGDAQDGIPVRIKRVAVVDEAACLGGGAGGSAGLMQGVAQPSGMGCRCLRVGHAQFVFQQRANNR